MAKVVDLDKVALELNSEIWFGAKFHEEDRVRTKSAPRGYPATGWIVDKIRPMRERTVYILRHSKANFGEIVSFDTDVEGDTPTFASRFAQLRKEGGLKQREVAEMLSYDPAPISGWETGARTPNLPTLITVAELFDCSLDYLTGLSDEKKRR